MGKSNTDTKVRNIQRTEAPAQERGFLSKASDTFVKAARGATFVAGGYQLGRTVGRALPHGVKLMRNGERLKGAGHIGLGAGAAVAVIGLGIGLYRDIRAELDERKRNGSS